MNSGPSTSNILREKLARLGALMVLLLLGGLALAGPYGLLSWSEQLSTLDRHETRLLALRAERDELANRVERLDPEHADPDLVTELLRQNLNVAHPDEYVIELEPSR